jgi:hypothetical protein
MLVLLTLAGSVSSWPVPPGLESKQRDSYENVPTFKVVTKDWTAAKEASETSAIEMDGKLYIAWQGKSPRPDGNGSRGAIYFRIFDDSGPFQNASWGPIFKLTPTDGSGDRYGHANDYPKIVNFSGKAHVLWESEDDSQKPAPRNSTMDDILMKSFDGEKWSDVKFMNDVLPNGTEYRCYHVGASVFQGKLYAAWMRVIDAHAEIVVRSYDGTAMSPETVVSIPSNSTRCDWPNFGQFKGSLYLIWEANDADAARTIIYIASNSGGGWSAPRPVYTIPIMGYKDTFPKLLDYQNPATGQDELWAVWRTVDGEGVVFKGSGDQDIVMRRVDGAELGPYVSISPAADTDDDTRPNAAVLDGRIYVVWQTKDKRTADGGGDYDIVMRSYDGLNLSPVSSLSRLGDRCESVTIDTEPHNLGDDEFPSVATYRGRLFSLYETYDNVTGMDDVEPGLNDRAIILKLAEDADSDDDSYPDSSDAFPYNANEWKDSDGDWVGDNEDFRPFNPDIQYRSQLPEPKNNDQSVHVMVIIIAVLAALAVVLVIPGGQKPAGKEPDAAVKDERPPAELRTSSGKCVRSLVCPDGQTQEAGGLHPRQIAKQFGESSTEGRTEIGAASLPPPGGGGLLSDEEE